MKILQYRFIAVLSVILFFQTINAQVILTHIGRHPFYPPSLTSSIELITMVNDNKNDVREGFEMVGLSELFDVFALQLPKADIKIVKIHDGSHFEWMFARKNGEGPVRVAKDVTWIGKEPFSALQFHIDQNDKRYNFAVPLVCGNIALRGMTRAPEVTVLPIEEIVVEPTTPVIEPTVPIVEPVESIVPIEPIESIAEPIKDTDHALVATAVGVSTLKIISDMGYLHQFDPGHYIFGRVGAEYNFTDNFSLLGLVGVAPHIRGTDGKTAFTADIVGEYKIDKSFVNLGIGGWFTKGDDDIPMENTQLDIVGAIGTRVYGESDDFNISLLFETRQGLGELSSVHDIRSFGRYGVGLRFRF